MKRDGGVSLLGFFDEFRDAIGAIGGMMQKSDPIGPIGTVGEMLTSVDALGDLVAERGTDALWNLAADAGELASVAQSMLPMAKQTLIIAGGLEAVLAMQYACGFTNPPHKGEGYNAGYQKFNDIADGLQSAFPNETWKGVASDAYHYANEKQRLRAKKMVDADISIGICMSAEAGAVANTRRILNNAATMMGNAIGPALAARVAGKYGKAASLTIETTVVATCLPPCIWQMNELAEHSRERAESIKNATRIYEEVARECVDINL